MRKRFWKYLINNLGEPIANARIHVFLSDEVTASDLNISTITNNIFDSIPSEGYAYISDSEDTNITNFEHSDVISITTNENGFFSFYIADKEEVTSETVSDKGYEYNTKFTIAWIKSGLDVGVLENIKLFGIKIEVNESDNTSLNTDRKNKLISNKQAYLWNEHKDSNFNELPHNIDLLDQTNSNTAKNKLVSNNDIKILQDHVDDNDVDGSEVHTQYLRRDGTTNMKSGASLITNLNADKLDGQHGSYYTTFTTNAVSTHSSIDSGIHGVTGDIVGTNDSQSLSNKTLTSSTFSGVIDSLSSPLTIPNGGTGSTTASGARTNLDVQQLNDNLTDISRLTPTDKTFIVGDDSNFVTETASSVRTIIDAQQLNDNLTDISSMSPSADSFIVGDGSNFDLLDNEDARTALGLGSAATSDTTDFLSSGIGVDLNSTTGTLELSGSFGIFGISAPSQPSESDLSLSTVTTGSDETIDLSLLNTQLSNVETKINNILTILSNYGLIS